MLYNRLASRQVEGKTPHYKLTSAAQNAFGDQLLTDSDRKNGLHVPKYSLLQHECLHAMISIQKPKKIDN